MTLSDFRDAGDWSHVAQTDSELKGDLWFIDLARNRKVVPPISTPFTQRVRRSFRTTRWLAFTSDESGRAKVYLQAFEAGDSARLVGERNLVSQHGASPLRWARNGRELFYPSWDGRIYAVPIKLPQAPVSGKPKIGEPASLFSVSLQTRAATNSLLGFDVSAEERRFLVPIVTSTEKTEIVLMAELGKKHRDGTQNAFSFSSPWRGGMLGNKAAIECFPRFSPAFWPSSFFSTCCCCIN